MANQAITAANVLASRTANKISSYNAGVAITRGQVVYLDASSLWQLLNAVTSQTTAGSGTTIGIALEDVGPNQPLIVCTSDPAFTPGFTVTPGVPYISSSTNGAIALPGDAGTGWIPAFLMVGLVGSTTQVNFNPVFGGGVHA